MPTYTCIQYYQSDGNPDVVWRDGTTTAHTHYDGGITALMAQEGWTNGDATEYGTSKTPSQANSYFSTTGFTNAHLPLTLYIFDIEESATGGSSGSNNESSSIQGGGGFNRHFDYVLKLQTEVPR